MSIEEEIKQYCKANELDYDKTLSKIIKYGFSIEKYGSLSEEEKQPPPEPIIKTVKEYVTDDSKVKELIDEISKLNSERDELKSKLKCLQEEITKLKDNKRDIYNEKF